jgi:uncharacterized membrane protein YdbT with pleckstrin-like domain
MSGHYLQSLLGERETIIHATRHHWFVLASSIILEIVLILIIFSATLTGSIYLSGIQSLAWPIVAFGGFILMLIPIITGTRDILNWANHQFIITNHRVMQISGIFNKSVIDSSLDKVNDIKMDQSALGRLFGYGDIEILTASELGVNLFKKIDNPVKFKSALINAKEYLEHAPVPEVAPPLENKTDIPQMISKLADLRSQGVLTEEEFQLKKSELLSKM